MVNLPFREFSLQPVERFVNGIGDVEPISVDKINRAEFNYRFKLNDLSPIVAAKQNNGRILANFIRLYQGKDFHEFVQRAKSTLHDSRRLGHIDQPGFSHEEVVELRHQPIGNILIGVLFKEQRNIHTDCRAASFFGPPVHRVHNAGTAAGDDRKMLAAAKPIADKFLRPNR